jgi:uncharacterized SAM-dependent methyltransferase
MLIKSTRKPLYDVAFAEAAKGFFHGKGLAGVFTYSSPNFPGDKVDGARLFIEFTKAPEYYPKRNEESIIPQVAGKIIGLAGYFNFLVDLGCGEAFSKKIKHFIGDADYSPVDMNQSYLHEVTLQCNELYPNKKVVRQHLDFLNDDIKFQGIPFPVMLGCTITNFGTTASVRKILKQVKPLCEQGNGSFVFSHDTNTNPASLEKCYTHPLIAEGTLNVLHRIKRDLPTQNFDPVAFRYHAYWEGITSTYNLCMIPKKDMTFSIDDEWFCLKKDQILPQAPLMKLPAEHMQALVKAEGFDHYSPNFDKDGYIALQHIHL